MKQLTFILAAGVLLSCLSCTSGGKDQAAEETPIPAASYKAIMVQHPVASYAAWKPVYMAHDSMREAFGITRYVVGRGTVDTNMIFVVNKISDLAKAKEFAAHPDLKMAMEKAGVTGPPTFSYLDVIRDENSEIPQKERLMVSHRVKDFDAWLKVYDAEGRTKRAEYGLLDRVLARGADDPNMVYIVFAVTDAAKAKARTESEELKKLMTDAGVEGPPQAFFYTLDN